MAIISDATTMTLDLRRRFVAEEIQAICGLKSAALVDALATVLAGDQDASPGRA